MRRLGRRRFRNASVSPMCVTPTAHHEKLDELKSINHEMDTLLLKSGVAKSELTAAFTTLRQMGYDGDLEDGN